MGDVIWIEILVYFEVELCLSGKGVYFWSLPLVIDYNKLNDPTCREYRSFLLSEFYQA